MAKVLLVEDDNNLREIYEARMQAEGYDVCTASDGEQALVVAKEQKPDLVISDVMMPKISGFEMLDILRNTDGLKDIKVIMLTALGQTDDQARADRLGADRYLVKSQVTLEDIVNVAHQLLNDLPESPLPEPVANVPEPTLVTTPLPAQPAPSLPDEPTTVVPVPIVPVPEQMVATTPITAIAVEPVSSTAVVEPSALVPSEPVGPVDPPEVVSDPQSTVPTAAPAIEPVPQTAFTAVQVEPPDNPSSQSATTPPSPETSEPTLPAALYAPDNVSTAQSSAQEEADVEAQIEDFVAGATSEAPATNNPTLPVVVSTTDAQKLADVASDDKLMANAVESLIASTPASNEAATSPSTEPVLTPEVPSATAATAEQGSIAVPQPTVEASLPTPQPVAPVSMIAGKKIISPLSNDEPKPDLNELLAKEEAKDILSQASQLAETPPAPTTASTEGKIDPNSIAL
jgi:CheY-like chemotaxis protein